MWLLNPERETLEVHGLTDARWLLLDTLTGDAVARIEPFDAAELELWRLWGRSGPR